MGAEKVSHCGISAATRHDLDLHDANASVEPRGNGRSRVGQSSRLLHAPKRLDLVGSKKAKCGRVVVVRWRRVSYKIAVCV